MVIDRVVAGTGIDRIGSPTAIDRIGARACDDRVGGCRARDGQRRRQRARIDALEIARDDRVAERFVSTGRDGEIDGRGAAGDGEYQRVNACATIDRGFRAAIGDTVIATAGRNDVRAAVAVKRICAGAAGDDVDAG